MRVLMMTQAVDPGDPVLGFTAGWVSALASHVDHVDVLCLRAIAGGHPPNVTVSTIGTSGDAGRISRLMQFERGVYRLVPRADVILSHMIPRYACCAGPIAMAARRPMLLWYTHRHDSFELRLASTFSRFVATAVASSFPFATPKLRVMGHGIDSRFFAPDPTVAPAAPAVILFAGRMAPVKRQKTLVEALTHLAPAHREARVVFAGAPDERGEYDHEVREVAARLGVNRRITFAGPLAPDALLDWYRRATVAVNLSPDGLFDKAALEGMMTGTPTIVAATAFDSLLQPSAAWLRIASGDDPVALARVLDRVMGLTPSARRQVATEVRERAIAAHALDGFMPRLVSLMRSAAAR
jgi:glycosyltransferase involved in cell wall biosynthesis